MRCEGLLRIIEASNRNTNIKSLNLGIVTGDGLLTIARSLQNNHSLQKLKFEECPDCPWEEKGKSEFIAMLK